MHSSRLSEDLVPVDVQVDDEMIRVRFSGGLELATPVARFPRLKQAPPEQRNKWQLNGKGYGIHWPEVDEDISVPGLFANAKPTPQTAIEQVPMLIGDLLKTTQRLNQLFSGRPFTPDGHLVGSIGEVVAEYIYDIKLEPCSTPLVDARTSDGKTIQVKLTGEAGTSFGVRWSNLRDTEHADILLCLKLSREGFQEIYNGPFPVQLLDGRPDQKNGQISLSLPKLQAINPGVLPKIRPYSSINRWFTPEVADVA